MLGGRGVEQQFSSTLHRLGAPGSLLTVDTLRSISEFPTKPKHTHTDTKVYIEQTIPHVTRIINNRVQHARIDVVYEHHGMTTSIDVAVVAPVSSSAALLPETSAHREVSASQSCSFCA